MTATPTCDHPPVPTRAGAGRREWTALAVLALPTLLVALDTFVMLLALPQLSRDLGASSTEQLWIMDVYGFMVAGSLITMGALGDRIGRRRLLLIGAAAFGVASVLAAYSVNPMMLILTRAAWISSSTRGASPTKSVSANPTPGSFTTPSNAAPPPQSAVAG